jgi:hypothetical protein
MESVRSVLVGELNLALVMAPPQDTKITAVPFAPAPLYAVLLETHPAAHKESVMLEDLAKDEWILFAKRVHPLVYETIMDTARRNSIVPKHAHNIMSPQQAVDLVSEHVGVAILTEPTPPGLKADGVVVKPLSDAALCLETCVVMRADDDSRLTNEYARAFLRKYTAQRGESLNSIKAGRKRAEYGDVLIKRLAKDLLAAILERVSVPLKKADLLTVAQHVLTSVPYNRLPLLAKRHKLEVEKSSASPVELLQKHVSRYDESGLSRFLLEASLLESAYRNDGEPDSDILLSTAKHYRIDAEKVQKAVTQEFVAKQKNKEKKTAPDKSTA